jgi:hypothetical protein
MDELKLPEQSPAQSLVPSSCSHLESQPLHGHGWCAEGAWPLKPTRPDLQLDARVWMNQDNPTWTHAQMIP